MKASFQTVLVLSFLFTTLQSIHANPTYTLQAKNFFLNAPNSMSWDLIITHTNSQVFEYAGGQFFFDFNGAIANGGTLTYTLDTANGTGSDFPIAMRPRNATVFNGGSGPWQLRLAANVLPGAGNGLILEQDSQMIIVRLKLSTTAPDFGNVSLDLQWRSALPNPFTKINAYIGTTNTDVTSPATHTIDPIFIFPPHVTCKVKFAIEGLYNPTTDRLMKKDSAIVYIRSINSPYQVLDSAKALIDSVTLTGTFDFVNTLSDSYYLVVKSKNSLETWSKSGGEFFYPGINNYDFTTSASQSYGSNMLLKGSRYCIYSGNINGDNFIDLTDMYLVDNDAFNYTGGSAITNLNGDNIVDIEDLAIVDRNARNLKSVQRPGALASSGRNKISTESLQGVKR